MITYAIRKPIPYIRGEILPWLKEHSIDALYDWPFSEFTFYRDEEAMMFYLKFGGIRVKTKLEKLLEQANND